MPTKEQLNIAKPQTYSGHKDCIYTLEQGPENKYFISGAGDGMVVLWNFEDPDQGQLIARVQASVYALAYIPAYNQLIIGQNFSGIHLIDLNDFRELNTLQITDASIFDIQFYNNMILVATGAGELIVVDYNTFKVIKKMLMSENRARTLAINRSKNQLAIGFSDNHIKILDLNTFKMIKNIEAHKNSVFSLQYNQDEKLLFSAGRDAHLNIWDSENNYQLDESIVAHMYTINNICFRPDYKLFATCSMDKTVKIWDTQSRKLLKVLDHARHNGHTTSVNKLFWSNYDNILISGSDDRTLKIWPIGIENQQ